MNAGGRSAGLHAFLAPVTPRPLGVLRITIASFGLVLALIQSPYLLQLYGQLGFIQWPVGELIVPPWLPRLGSLASLLTPLGISPTACVRGIFALYLIGLVGLLVGWKTRVMAAVAWLLHLTMTNSGFFSTYGVDVFLHIALFYCVWMPVGASLSLDTRLAKIPPEPSFAAALSLRALQIHLCIVYATATFSKLQGLQWWNGEAIWLAFTQPQFARFDLSWLSSVAWLPTALGWTVLLIEGGYAFLIWPRRTRGLWLGATIGLHAGIGVLLGLWMFAAVMIILNCCAFGYLWLAGRGLAERRSGRVGPADEGLAYS